MRSFIVRILVLWLLTVGAFTAQADTFVVTNANNTGVGSLRWAIGAANSNAVADTIEFNIPGPGPHVIDVVTALPLIYTPVSILGDTQPGYAGTPLVEIHGPTPDFFDIGIWLQSSNSVIRGLRATGFTMAGIAMEGPHNASRVEACVVDYNNDGLSIGCGVVGGTVASNRNIIVNNLTNGIVIYTIAGKAIQVLGNYIGVAADGVTPAGNGENGIKINYGQNVTIKGGAAYPQVISGNGQNGIFLSPNGGYVQYCSNNIVQGNFVGVDATGTNALPNKTGIYIWGGHGNTIGGTSPDLRNVIAGNTEKGLDIGGINIGSVVLSGHHNNIYGNYFGLGSDGETILPNDVNVQVVAGFSNRVGGASAGQGNRFGAADFYHVWIYAASLQAYDNTVAGNTFGFTASTQLIASAGPSAVRISSASNNVVGGITTGARNYFGGVDTGVSIDGTNARNNRVIGNWFGVKPDGSAAQVNSYGIEIWNARNNEVGGTTTNEGNVISGCQAYGVRIFGDYASGNIVQGNLIGTDPTVTFSISNRYAGVDMAGGAYSNRIGATNFQIYAMNVFAGNAGVGVGIRDSNTFGNIVCFNFFGLTRGGAAFSNESYGINVYQSPSNQIGPANYVGNHPTTGINLSGADAVGNRIIGNMVGMDIIGNYHPNANGIGSSAPGTIIGGPSTLDRNFIGGNRVNGVDIGTGGHGSVIQGNLIGLNAFGTGVVSNRQYGIYVLNANNVVIGGLNDARNIVAGSRLTGILVAGTSSNTIIAGNYIGTTLDGQTRLGVGTAGIGVDASHTIVGVPLAGLGNIIVGAGSAGIAVNHATNVLIRNNTVGLGADGITNIPNAQGIWVRGSSRQVQIGGTNSLHANIVARNSGSEVILEGPSAESLVQGNFIGVMNGGVAFPTGAGGFGIEVINSPSNRLIGNVIGQVGDAIRIASTGSAHNVALGNFIGEYNLEPIVNTGWGVYILNASDNTIGGLPQDERNFITRNGGGVIVTNQGSTNAINNRIAANLIYSNSTSLNIDLGPRGPNANDAQDVDAGANGLQNKPFITNAVTSGGGLVYVQGVLNSAPFTTYAIDVYRSGSTNAEAFRYIGRSYVGTDINGNGEFIAGFPFTLAVGQYIAATATDPDGNTSELFATPTGATAATMTDADNDGIPTYWETLYGLNPAVSNGPASDVDTDGFSDYEEYIADTAANDGAKYPVIVDLAIATNRDVTFPSSNLRVYKLESNSEIADNPAWTQIGGSVTGLYGQTTMADTNAPDWTMYRVGVRLP